MKHMMLTLGLAAIVATGLNAQHPNPATLPAPSREEKVQLTPAERARKDAEHAEKTLGLNGDQRSKWEAASLERATANEPIREKMKGCTTPQERKDFHAQMKANQKKYNTTVVALLTPDQKAKFDQQKKDRREARKGGKMKGRHHPPQGNQN